jgi:hypothetical protein
MRHSTRTGSFFWIFLCFGNQSNGPFDYLDVPRLR